MILILSEAGDTTTNKVMDWLSFYQIPYCRINEEDHLYIRHFSLNSAGKPEFSIKVRQVSISSGEITGYFYRRGFLNFNIKVPKSNDQEIYEDLRNHIRQDSLDFNVFITHFLENQVPHIGEFNRKRVNKLMALMMAADCGLSVPATYISEDISQVENILQREKSLITKGISDTFTSDSSRLGIDIACYTSRVSHEDIRSTDRPIAPTLFQVEIDKLLEVRSFYLAGRFYSMAIISQHNHKTSVDYRQYDTEHPNRNVPFQLPDHIEQKLHTLMQRLGLSTGSIDLIVDTACNYYFLEVNPVGQFGSLSETCNYQLEKQIAEYFHAKNG